MASNHINRKRMPGGYVRLLPDAGWKLRLKSIDRVFSVAVTTEEKADHFEAVKA